MVKNEEGNDYIRNWMRNRNTIEYLGTWEGMYNQYFKGVEFDTFRKEAGLKIDGADLPEFLSISILN